jgi:hypothetical protein
MDWGARIPRACRPRIERVGRGSSPSACVAGVGILGAIRVTAFSRQRVGAIGLVPVALVSPPSAIAQTLTSGSLSGRVIDQQEGVLAGAVVLAVHEPTGERLETTTDRAGRFQFLNVRVGGPYTVTTTLAGFADHVDQDVFVALGEVRLLLVQMKLGELNTTVDVTPQAIFDPTRAGPVANVGADAVASLPTIQRSLTDIARTSPYFNALSSNGAEAAPSVAGRNKFFNTIQVDGAPFNDQFGASQTGPGGQAGAQPISLETINEVQLVVAPYDVRQGGFSGRGINAVTKSGSNQLHGTGYGFGQTSNLVARFQRSSDRRRQGLARSAVISSEEVWVDRWSATAFSFSRMSKAPGSRRRPASR